MRLRTSASNGGISLQSSLSISIPAERRNRKMTMHVINRYAYPSAISLFFSAICAPIHPSPRTFFPCLAIQRSKASIPLARWGTRKENRCVVFTVRCFLSSAKLGEGRMLDGKPFVRALSFSTRAALAKRTIRGFALSRSHPSRRYDPGDLSRPLCRASTSVCFPGRKRDPDLEYFPFLRKHRVIPNLQC